MTTWQPIGTAAPNGTLSEFALMTLLTSRADWGSIDHVSSR